MGNVVLGRLTRIVAFIVLLFGQMCTFPPSVDASYPYELNRRGGVLIFRTQFLYEAI